MESLCCPSYLLFLFSESGEPKEGKLLMEKIDVPSNPGRLINAIASIGYDTEIALTDIMDNSIDAEASIVEVRLDPEPRAEEGDADTIHQYVIADDGFGMDDKTIISAFTLGTERKYRAHSLGKFGLGLKSAGLALASQICVVTKTAAMGKPLYAELSLPEVEETGRYQIGVGEPPEEMVELWKSRHGDAAHGTIVVLRNLNENQPAYASFLEYFKRYSSLVYHLFIERAKLNVFVNGTKLAATDPLFLAEAEKAGALSPESWDGRTPSKLFDLTAIDLAESVQCVVMATHLVHPPSFEGEGKRDEARERYGIEADPYTRRPRHGFYIYRNERIIATACRVIPSLLHPAGHGDV